jgi:hypothetical protein
MNIIKNIVKENGIVNIINNMKKDIEENTCNLCDKSLNLILNCYECEKFLCNNHNIHINNIGEYLCYECYKQKNQMIKKYYKCKKCKYYYLTNFDYCAGLCYCGEYICNSCIDSISVCNFCNIPICKKCEIYCEKCYDIFCSYCIYKNKEICCDKMEENINKMCNICLQYLECNDNCISHHT